MEISGARIRSLIFPSQAPTCFMNIRGCDIGDAYLNFYARAPGANITVCGANTTIHNMMTDTAGYAQCNLEYKDRFEIVKFPNPGGPYTITEFNMTSPVIMTVSHSGDVYQKEVWLLTTTPIEVTFPVYTRPQREAIAALLSVALILIAVYASSRRG